MTQPTLLPTWDMSCRLGIPRKDAYIYGCFRILRFLNDATRFDPTGAEVGVILEFLLRNLQTHFAEEQTSISRSGYPGEQMHLKAHRAILQLGHELKWQYETGPTPITPTQVLALMEALRDHVSQMDVAFVAYLSHLDRFEISQSAG
jgi:hemerythrin-like metal-binding protein